MSISTKSTTSRTAAATEAQLARFKTPGERSAYFRSLGEKSAEGRIILSPTQAEALRQAYSLLLSLAPKLEKPATDQPD